MYIIATFEQTIHLELAITLLEKQGIPRQRILAVPLENRTQPSRWFNTIHRADGVDMFDLSAILSTIFMLLGSIYGFVLEWGPVLWGIIGAVSGILTGFFVKWLLVLRRNPKARSIASMVVLLIRCEETQKGAIEQILWDNIALGTACVDFEKRERPPKG